VEWLMGEHGNTTRRSRAIHSVVAEHIREGIASGRLVPGALVESEHQLCRRFGVSRGPVRQALASLERDGLVYRVPGKGSFVSHQRPGGGSEREAVQIGVIVDATSGISGGFCILEIIEGLNQAVERSQPECRLVFAFHRFSGAGDQAIGQFLERGDCAGFLLVPITRYCLDFAAGLSPRAVPVVSLFRRAANHWMSQVYVDHEAGAYAATEYLIRYGHRRIGMVAIKPNWWDLSGEERIGGYRRAMKDHSVEVRPEDTAFCTSNPLEVRAAVQSVLARPGRPSALLIGGGSLTEPALQAIRELEIRVPQDLSVIAFDDTPSAQGFDPALTVVKQPLERTAGTGLDRLMAEIERPGEKAAQTGLAPELVVRGSCRAI